jgi:hypothetical protein
MAEIRITNVEALGKPIGPYSHVARVKGGETLYIAGMVAPGETFEAQCAAVYGLVPVRVRRMGGFLPIECSVLPHLVDVASGPAEPSLPRQQAVDMTAPETFAKPRRNP